MATQIDELARERGRLLGLIGTQHENGLVGSLRVELLNVQQEISAVSVDTPTEKVTAALQQEIALTLRISCGEGELKRVTTELRNKQLYEAQAQQRVEAERQEKQKQRASVIAQIRVIDDQLSGRKPIHVATGPAGSDYVGNMAIARRHLEQTRSRVMKEHGLSDDDVLPKTK